MTTLTYGEENMTVNAPAKNLTKGLNKKAGRGAGGRISVRRRGGGHKRSYRIIDFKRDKFGVPGKVASIEYDPNRTANIALIFYADGEKRYILSVSPFTTSSCSTEKARSWFVPPVAALWLPPKRVIM